MNKIYQQGEKPEIRITLKGNEAQQMTIIYSDEKDLPTLETRIKAWENKKPRQCCSTDRASR